MLRWLNQSFIYYVERTGMDDDGATVNYFQNILLLDHRGLIMVSLGTRRLDADPPMMFYG
jgi:hypothetical protein